MNFDLIVILIFLTVFITGYIRGAGIELLRVLKVIIPFLILYYFGDFIITRILSADKISRFVYRLLRHMHFKNTIAALSTQILLYILVYTFLALFLWRLGKYVLDERIEYFFGKTNAIMGGVFAIIRMYIIMSFILIPFYVLNFTNHNDFTTRFILNHPPKFSKIGHVLADSKPTLDKINELTASFKVMDLDSLKKYTALLTEIDEFLSDKEEKATRIYAYLWDEGYFEQAHSKEEFLFLYVNDFATYRKLKISDREIDRLNQNLLDEIEPYQQVILWAYQEDVRNKQTFREVVDSFIIHYPQIAAKTNDHLTIELLTKTKSYTQIYLTLMEFLTNDLGLHIQSNRDLLKDENLYRLLESYGDYHVALVARVTNLDQLDRNEKALFISQLNRFYAFQQKYISNYKGHIELYDVLLQDVSFKYKLGFAILKENKFEQVVYQNLRENPTLFLFIVDSIDFLSRFDDVYMDIAQVYTALFLLKKENNHQSIDMQILLAQLEAINDFELENYELKQTINKIFHAFVVRHQGESYLDYLINQELLQVNDLETLYQSPTLKSLLTVKNYDLLQVIYFDYRGDL